MTYKLNPEVRKISSPIILEFCEERERQRFADGTALAEAVFNKNYCIESISAKENCILLTVRENDRVNATNWIGEETAEPSFF